MDDRQFGQELSSIKTFIEEYLLTRCRLKGKLLEGVKELDRFFCNTPYSKEQLERHKLEIGTYIKQCRLHSNEYLIDTYKYHIEFEEVEVQDENCRVTFMTDEIKKYRCTNEMTLIKEMPHSMLLQRQRGKWLIVEHLCHLEFIEALEIYKKKYDLEDLEKSQEIYLGEVAEIKSQTKAYSIKKVIEDEVYDRMAVVKYAMKYALESDEHDECKEDLEESSRFAMRCMEQGGCAWHDRSRIGMESELRKGDLVKITNLKEGIHSMIVTDYVYSLFHTHKVVGYLVSQRGDCERNVPLAVKPYPREYRVID